MNAVGALLLKRVFLFIPRGMRSSNHSKFAKRIEEEQKNMEDEEEVEENDTKRSENHTTGSKRNYENMERDYIDLDQWEAE